MSELLEDRFDDHPHVGDIRGRGLLQAIELVADRSTKAPFDPELKLHERARNEAFLRGLLVYPGGGTADGRSGDHILLAPPYNVTDGELEIIVDLLDQTIEAAGDQPTAGGFVALEIILARELDRCLGRFRTAASEPHPIEAGRHLGNERRQPFRGIGREESRVRIFERRCLLRHRRDHRGIAVPKARHGRPSACIDEPPAVLIDEKDALATDRNRWPTSRVSVKDMICPHSSRLAWAAGTS
jgi:hypothetical protein